MVDDETTIGVYVGHGEAEIIEDFDDVVSNAELHDGRYSRSESIKDAMQMHQTVIEAAEAAGIDIDGMSQFELRSIVRQAIIDMD